MSTAQHRDLMPQHQQLDVLRRRRPAEQDQPAAQLDKDEVQHSQRHAHDHADRTTVPDHRSSTHVCRVLAPRRAVRMFSRGRTDTAVALTRERRPPYAHNGPSGLSSPTGQYRPAPHHHRRLAGPHRPRPRRFPARPGRARHPCPRQTLIETMDMEACTSEPTLCQ